MEMSAFRCNNEILYKPWLLYHMTSGSFSLFTYDDLDPPAVEVSNLYSTALCPAINTEVYNGGHDGSDW